MVSAWAGKNSMVPGQVKVDQKSVEIHNDADYVLAVKKNNRKLYESLELFFQQATPGSSNNVDYFDLPCTVGGV